MNSLAMVQAVEAWAVATIPALSSFEFPPEELSSALPIVIAEITDDGLTQSSDALPGMAQFQQTDLRLWSLDVTLMVSPDPAWTASHTLYGYVDALGTSLRGGRSLGDKVVMSQYYDASYTPPEVEYPDGTIARQVTISVIVGETIGA